MIKYRGIIERELVHRMALDVTGERYGWLTAIEPTGRSGKSGGMIWRFQCKCGEEVEHPLAAVRRGNSPIESCEGCAEEYAELKRQLRREGQEHKLADATPSRWGPSKEEYAKRQSVDELAEKTRTKLAVEEAREHGISVGATMEVVGGDLAFVNSDGSWNLNNAAVRAVMKKHEGEKSPFDALTRSEESKLMSDGGRRLDMTDTLLKLGQTREQPTTEEALFERLYEYFAVCQHYSVPPTYPLFCVWCGMSMSQLEGSHARVYRLREAVALCRETIRGFLELSAMDNALSPLIYFHQQKVYFGAVETSKVQVEEVTSDEEKMRELEGLISSITPVTVEVIDVED